MTDQEFIFFVRSLLNEASEKTKFWLDTDIEAYKKVAISIVNGLFWNHLYIFKKKHIDLTVPSTSRTIALPAGCQKVIRLEYAKTGQKVPYIPDDMFFQAAGIEAGTTVYGWGWEDGKIYIFPQITTELTDYLRLWYLPRATTLADLPDELHPLIAVETIMCGREKDEKVGASLEIKRNRYYQAALKSIILSQTQDQEAGAEVGREENWSYY